MFQLPTLRHWVASLDETALAALLDVYPMVKHGGREPDVDAIAARLAHPATVTTVLTASPLPLLQVIETTVALGLGATVDRLCALLDRGDSDAEHHEEHVRRWLEQASARGLVWVDGERLRVNPGIGAVITAPLGLARPAELALPEVTVETIREVARGLGLPTAGRKDELIERVSSVLADPAEIRRRVATAPAEVLSTLTTTVNRALHRARPLAAGYQDDDEDIDDYAQWSRTYQETRALRSWLTSAGLALPTPSWRSYSTTVEIFAEVYLALAPSGFVLPFAPRPPRVATTPVPEEQVGRSAAAAASDFLATAMAVLEGLSRRPLSMVKAGGIGAREIARHAKSVGVGSAAVRLSVSLAAGCGLLAITSEDELTVDDGFDEWRRQVPAERAADLSTAWLAEDIPPTLDRDADGKVVPILGADPRRSYLELGLELCGLAAELAGHALAGPAPLMDLLAWQLPLVAQTPPGAAERSWAEAHQLGLLADGSITPLGQALIDGDRDGAVATLDAMLPGVSGQALIGSDHTILVPGSPDPDVVDVLDIVATREARGAANTWRVSPESVRDALDAGHTVEDLIESLAAISRKELPQALRYLMRDVARKHGHLTVHSGACAITSEDQALLAEVVATRGLRALELHLVAPTVALSAKPVTQVLSHLRAAGYLPITADGKHATVQLGRRPGNGDTDAATRAGR